MQNKYHLGKAITVFFSTITVNVLVRNVVGFGLAEPLKENDAPIINFLKKGELTIHGAPNDIKVKDNYAFIGTQKNGLQIIDISDSTNPTLVGRYNTTYDSDGSVYPIKNIAFKDNLIFLAEGLGGLRIIDIQNVTIPTAVSVYFTGWSVAQLAIVGNRACLVDDSELLNFAIVDISEPKRIWRNGMMDWYDFPEFDNSQRLYVLNDIAYIANTGFNNLQIIDISDTNYPKTLSEFPMLAGMKDISIDESRKMAYIIVNFTDRNGSLRIVNISNLGEPKYITENAYSIKNPHRIIVDNNIAYIVYSGGLKIIDVTFTNNILALGEYSTNTTCECDMGSQISIWIGITKQDQNIFMLDCTGLVIINVSDATKPQPIGTFNSRDYGEGSYSCTNGSDIVIQDEIVYIMTSTSSLYPANLDELQLIDVSNPVSPQPLAVYSSWKRVYYNGRNFMGIHVSDQKVYLATGPTLEIIDVHNRTHPYLLHSYSVPGFAQNVKVIDDVVYLACNGLNGGFSRGLLMIDTSISPMRQPLGKLSYQTGSQVTQILPDSRGIFILYTALGLNWLNVNAYSVHTYLLSDEVGAIKINKKFDKAYLFVQRTEELQILDVSNISDMKKLANYSITRMTNDLAIIESITTIAYIISDEGLQIFDVSDPLQIKMLHVSKSLTYKVIYIKDNIAYFAETWPGAIDAFDIDNLGKPKHLGIYDYGRYTINALNDFTIINNIGYLVGSGAIRNNGLQIVNFNNPTSPLPIIYYPSDGISIDFYHGNVYLVHYDASGKNVVIEIINLKDPSEPVSLGKFNFLSGQLNHPNKIRIHNNIAYVTSSEGLALFSVFDPTYPKLIGMYRSGGKMPLVEFMGENNVVVADNQFGLHFITKASFSDSRFPMRTLPIKMTFSNRTAYVVDHLKTLYTINVENRLNLTSLSAGYQFINDVQSLLVKDDFLYAAVGKSGIEVIDVYDPASPKRVSFLQGTIAYAKLLSSANKNLLVLDTKKGLNIYEIIGQPLVVNHQFSMVPGESVVVTPLQLSARDTNVDADPITLRFMISHLQHGRFEWITHPGIALTNFTQHAIHAGKIKLVSTELDRLPSFRISVTNGISTAVPLDAIVRPNANVPPHIVNNHLTLNEGESVILAAKDLSASDLTLPSPKLRFITNDISNGRFEHVGKPGLTITNFLGQNITSGMIRFVHTGSGFDKPSYKVTVSNGQLESLLSNATISFNAAPKLINNQLFITRGATVVLTNENLQATDIDDDNATLLFTISQIEHGAFNQVNFTQGILAQGQITFTHDDTDQPPIYWVNVSDRHMNVGPQKAVTSLSLPINSTAIAIGATVGGVALGTLIAFVIWYRRRAVEANTRKHNPFADYVRDALKLKDVDDFNSQKGKYYVGVMQKLHDEFAQQGNSLEERDDRELRDIAKMVAEAARNKITTSSTLFGYSLITTAEIESKIRSIVLEVVRRRVGVLDEEPGVDLENLAADAEYSADQDAII